MTFKPSFNTFDLGESNYSRLDYEDFRALEAAYTRALSVIERGCGITEAMKVSVASNISAIALYDLPRSSSGDVNVEVVADRAVFQVLFSTVPDRPVH